MEREERKREKGKKDGYYFSFDFLVILKMYIINYWHLQCCANPPPKLRYTFTATPNIIMITTRFMDPV